MTSTDAQLLLAHQQYGLYAEYVDQHRFDEWADLFADDGVWVTGSKEISGRDNLRGSIAKLMKRFDGPTQHTISNVVVRPDDDGVSLRADFALLVQRDGAVTILSMGSYASKLAWDGGRWRFARHEMVVAGSATSAPKVTQA